MPGCTDCAAHRWKGEVFIVAPKQTPHWLNTDHPRIHVVDQDALYPEDDRQFLPTFNTNSIEQWLYNTPGLPGEIFIHMNDDYLFAGALKPQDLFGPTCQGVRVLVENRCAPKVISPLACCRPVFKSIRCCCCCRCLAPHHAGR